MSDCPEYDVLLSLSQLFDGRPEAALTHISSCSACAERLRLLGEIQQALTVPTLLDPKLTDRITASIHECAVAERHAVEHPATRHPARVLDGVLAAVTMLFGLLLAGGGAGRPLGLIPVAVIAGVIGLVVALAPRVATLPGGRAA